MILDAIEATKRAALPSYEFDRLLVCGMGGSAVGGDLAMDVMRAYDIPLQIEVSRRYALPPHVDRNTLMIFSSYSGETEETLSQFAEARRKGLQMICMSSGGRLKKWVESFGLPFVELPAGFKPRAALPYSLFTILEYLREAGKLDVSSDIDETVNVLTELRNNAEKDNEVMSLAGLMANSRISVYAADAYEAAARRLKNQINENGKLPASWNVFPEMDHNEIVGYEDNDLNKDSYVLLLRDADEHPAVRARIEATKELIRGKVKGVAEIWAEGKSKLAKEMSLVFLGDMLSYYLAKHGGKNPDKTENIDTLKAVLKEKLNTQENIEKELV
jgi:glucose/mannose-6-phosphate isomerase